VIKNPGRSGIAMPATWDYQLPVGIDIKNSGYAGAILHALSLFRKISRRVASRSSFVEGGFSLFR
jgi:hypothetical protein